MAGQRRIRVTIVLGPADAGSVTLFRWLLSHIIAIHADSPVPLRIRVEVLPEDDVD